MNTLNRAVLCHLKERSDGKGWECKFCGQHFSWGVTVKTFRIHLTGIQRSSSRIGICPSVPNDVKEAEAEAAAAAAAAVQVVQTRPKRTRAVSIREEAVQGREVEEGCSRVEDNWDTMKSVPRANKLPDEADVSKYEGQEMEAETEAEEEVPSVQSNLEGTSYFPAGELRDQLEGIVEKTTQPIQSNKRQKATTNELPVGQSTGSTLQPDALPMVECNQQMLVGEAFEINKRKIWSWLMDDQVLRVGIYGMGGVGKSTLIRHIQSCLKSQSSFKVYWVTVSQDFSIWELQNRIAKEIGFNFSEDDDEVKRAKELTQELKTKGRCVLILDDLWNYLDMVKVGIPLEVDGCKLVLTTRYLHVCQQIFCHEKNTVRVQPLSREEAWILFTKELGDYSHEVEDLAEAVSNECGGLPLGIKVMARTMRGIHEVHGWRNALEELKESKVTIGHEMREQILAVLKLSYLHLNDPALRECLLYLALFPEDHFMFRHTLIDYLIIEGIIDEKKSREAEFDRGHTMVDRLINACLLEGDNENVWMHDLIRDMAIYELREQSNTLVEAGKHLKELPDVEKWRENLVRVSLVDNDIELIHSSHTPSCPDLLTLLLSKNRRLGKIADSFFEQFQKLKILDLSWCAKITELPVSISNLVNLSALLLFECERLSHVPSLAKLKRLKRLDLCGCERLEMMPEGMELLFNLKYLDVSRSGIKEIQSVIIAAFSRLQVLILYTKVLVKSPAIEARELGMLRMLETLRCSFRGPKEWLDYMESREKSQQLLSDYSFCIGEERLGHPRDSGVSKDVRIIGCSGIVHSAALPTDMEVLTVESCDRVKGLLPPILLPNLKVIEVVGCQKVKRLFPPNSLPHLQNLEKIQIWGCDNMEEIFSITEEEEATTILISNLKSIVIWNCPKLKKLFPLSLLPNLHNLQNIKVSDSRGMEEIFPTNPTSNVNIGLDLPNLSTLQLLGLPNMRSIYNGAMICHSLQELELVNCPKLKRITLPLPQPSLRRIQVYPEKWWESVQWGDAKDKIRLRSLCVFKEDLFDEFDEDEEDVDEEE